MPLEKEGKLVPEFEGKNFDKQQKRKKRRRKKMKKLMIAMAIAGAVGFAQAELTTKVDFEQGEGVTPVWSVDGKVDIQADEGKQEWAVSEDDDLESNRYVVETAVKSYTTEGETPLADAGDQFLALTGITGLLERYAQAGGGAYTIPVGGVYIDTLVKFTVTEDEAPTVSNGDKLCIWLRKDGDGNPTNTLMVTAGYVYDTSANVSNMTYETNVKFVDGEDVDTWHRLTVEAISKPLGIDDAVGSAFVITVDSNKVVSAVGEGNTICPELMEFLQSAEVTLDPKVAAYFENKQLFPCLIKGDDGNSEKITSIGFKGTGAIDNLQFTETNPCPAPGPGAEDWKDPTDPEAMTTMSNQVAFVAYPSLADSALANANAANLTTWAKANSIDFADVAADTTGDYVNAYLLNCDPDDVDTEDDDFQLTISFDAEGNLVVELTDEAKAKGYNVQPVIKGAQSVNGPWHNKTDGDTFFKAVLELPSAD